MAPRKCCVKSCTSSVGNSNVHYHGLPSCPETRQKWCEWIAAVNAVNDVNSVRKSALVCSDHFDIKQRNGNRLCYGAVPSLLVDVQQFSNEGACSNALPEENEHNHNYYEVDASSNNDMDYINNSVTENPVTNSVTMALDFDAHLQPTTIVYIDPDVITTQENAGDVDASSNNDMDDSNNSVTENPVINSVTMALDFDAHLQPTTIVYIDPDVITTQENAGDVDASSNNDMDDSNNSVTENPVTNSVTMALDFDAHLQPTTIVYIHPDVITTQENAGDVDASSNNDMDDILYQFRDFITFAHDQDGPDNEVSSVTYINTNADSDASTNNLLANRNIVSEEVSIKGTDANRASETEDIIPSADIIPLSNNHQHIKKPGQRKCSAKGCVGTGHMSHSFPSTITNGEINVANLNRCKVWIKNSGNDKFLELRGFNPHKHFYLCSDHFDDEQYYNSSRRKLRQTAVPTRFDQPPLTDEQVSNLFQLTHEDIVHVDIDPVEYSIQDRYIKKFSEIMNNLERRTCPKCKETFLVRKPSRIKCLHSKEICLQYSDLNDMDPGEQPPELKGLTYIEEQLIARISPVLSVFKLKGHQLGYSGNVINFPQDIKPIAKQLPHRLEDLSSVMTVRAGSEIKPVNFQIRVEKVRTALRFLIDNNPYYYDVEISEENLNLLPEDGNLYDKVKCFVSEGQGKEENTDNTEGTSTRNNEFEPQEQGEKETFNDSIMSGSISSSNGFASQEQEEKENLDDSFMSGSSVSDNTSESHKQGEEVNLDGSNISDSDSEDEESYDTVIESGVPMIGKPSENHQLLSVLNWPTREKKPINECSMLGYVCMAFPCLFPCGKADLNTPREQTISALNYFKHLMRFHDDRFAKHPRFRFFALNSLMRWSALKDGNVFIQNNEEYKDMTAADLKELVQNDPNVLKKMMFQSSNIRGTRSYWYARGKELLSMIEQIGLPTLFFTLSCADFHWPDLYKILAPDKDFITESDRRKLIEENPELVDAFFSERASTFVSEVLKKKFDVEDFWFRVEYQHRGSPHIHGLLWIKDAPDVTNISNASVEDKEKIIKFFDKLVKTKHPNLNEPKAATHPCRIQPSEVEDLQKDLAQLLNMVQRHTKCSDSYCIRMNRKTKRKQCRFDFPKELQEVTELVLNDKNEYELVTERNDSRLNNYNPYVIQSWRANIDFSPVLSKQRLISYLAKYISKPEKESKQLIDILKDLLSTSDGDKSAKNIIQRLYIQCCSERDYSAQETCHLVSGRKLVCAGGRRFVTINFKSDSDWIFVPKNGNKNTKTIFDRYKSRADGHENECLCAMAKNCNFYTGQKYLKEAIVQIYPRFKRRPTQDDENNNPFYRQQVLLYVPWRDENEFLADGLSWGENYELHQEVIQRNTLKELDFTDISPQEEEFEETEDDQQEIYSVEEWMAISNMGINQNIEAVELGKREVDLKYDWHKALPQYEKYGGVPILTSFLETQKAQNMLDTSIPPFPTVNFSSEQENILQLLDMQIRSVSEENFSANYLIPKRIIVQGKAGTGKSLIIQAMTHKIHAALGHGAYLILTPTGVSAKNINGSTYHSVLCINSKTKEFVPLKGQAAHNLEKKFQKVLFILIDEYSMVGCNAMNMIQDRIQQAKGFYGEDFGGCFVYLFGDVQQLPPVGDTPVYSDKQLSSERLRGKLVFNNFQGAVFLTKIQRQKDATFQEVLNNVGDGKVTTKDYNILKSRFTTAVTNIERDKFKDAVHLYATRLEVLNHNKNRLENLTDANNQYRPIARVPAWHNCNAAARGTIDDAEGLHPVLYLSEGCTIMLKQNIWTEVGLVNGAIGEVVHILYEDNACPPDGRPVAIVCRFRSFNGPFLDNELKTILLVPVSRSWTNKQGESCTRIQYPITLCYACSIHSSQSLSLDLAYINLGTREMATGITYVALSRVKTLSGVLIEPFAWKRISKLNQRKSLKSRNSWLEDLKCNVLSLDNYLTL